MKNASLLAAAATLFAAPVFADDTLLTQAGRAQSLHDGPADMTVYYTPAEDGLLDVVATYAPRDVIGEPGRVVLRMREGDRTSFALPGIHDVTYSFARAGEMVTMRADERVRTASN